MEQPGRRPQTWGSDLRGKKNAENAEFQEVQRTRRGFYDEHFLKGELARLGCHRDNMKSLHTITNCIGHWGHRSLQHILLPKGQQ